MAQGRFTEDVFRDVKSTPDNKGGLDIVAHVHVDQTVDGTIRGHQNHVGEITSGSGEGSAPTQLGRFAGAVDLNGTATGAATLVDPNIRNAALRKILTGAADRCRQSLVPSS